MYSACCTNVRMFLLWVLHWKLFLFIMYKILNLISLRISQKQVQKMKIDCVKMDWIFLFNPSWIWDSWLFLSEQLWNLFFLKTTWDHLQFLKDKKQLFFSESSCEEWMRRPTLSVAVFIFLNAMNDEHRHGSGRFSIQRI